MIGSENIIKLVFFLENKWTDMISNSSSVDKLAEQIYLHTACLVREKI